MAHIVMNLGDDAGSGEPAAEQPALFDLPTPAELPSFPAGGEAESLAEQAAELDDTAAELDDTDQAQPDDPPETDPPQRYSGKCIGGLYHGRTMISRYPKGFLLVDRPSDTAWVYDLTPLPFPTFVCRDPAGAPLDESGRWRAAEEATYDVIAYDDGPATG